MATAPDSSGPPRAEPGAPPTKSASWSLLRSPAADTEYPRFGPADPASRGVSVIRPPGPGGGGGPDGRTDWSATDGRGMPATGPPAVANRLENGTAAIPARSFTPSVTCTMYTVLKASAPPAGFGSSVAVFP